MFVRRFAAFALSAAVGYGIALHELPKHRSVMAATSTAATIVAPLALGR